MTKTTTAPVAATIPNGQAAALPAAAADQDTAAVKAPRAIVAKAVTKAAAKDKPAAKPAAVKAAAKPAAAKAAAKPAEAKPVATKAAAKPAAAKPAAKPAAKAAAKPAAKVAAPKAKPAAAKAAVKPDSAAAKARKPKLVRDSFTMPEGEYAVLGQVKKACLKAGFEIKKSELLRIGVALISQIDMATLQTVLAALPQLKTGRPKKS